MQPSEDQSLMPHHLLRARPLRQMPFSASHADAMFVCVPIARVGRVDLDRVAQERGAGAAEIAEEAEIEPALRGIGPDIARGFVAFGAVTAGLVLPGFGEWCGNRERNENGDGSETHSFDLHCVVSLPTVRRGRRLSFIAPSISGSRLMVRSDNSLSVVPGAGPPIAVDGEAIPVFVAHGLEGRGMTLLIAAIVIFFGIHLVPTMGDLRGRLVGRLGESGYRAMFAVLSAASLILLIYAFAKAPSVTIWSPPSWTRWIAIILMWPAFIFLVAAYVPGK